MKHVSMLFAVPVTAAVLALSLAACGGDGEDGGAAPSQSTQAATGGSSAKPATGGHNDADVMFAQMMIPHHEQAVEMAALVPSRASMPEVKQLGSEIDKAQAPEIRQMAGWLKQWGAPSTAPDIEHMGHSMPGIVSDADMKKIKAASGKAFDKLFLEHMIAHHEGAIAMAKTELAEGTSAEAKTLADAIIKTQTAEITKMKELLGKL